MDWAKTWMQEETRNNLVLGFGATYTRGFTVLVSTRKCQNHDTAEVVLGMLIRIQKKN